MTRGVLSLMIPGKKAVGGAGTQVSETLPSSLLHVLDTQRGRGSGQSTLSTPHVSPISQGGGHRSRKELRNGQLLEKGLGMETKPLGYVNTDSTLKSCGGYAGSPQHIAHFAGIKRIYTRKSVSGYLVHPSISYSCPICLRLSILPPVNNALW